MTAVPLLDTIRGYNRSWLTPDLAAAVTVWAIVVPESMAYASIAGMPPETGLYAASIPVIVYALFASSRRVTFGPSAAIASISAATVAPLASGDPERVFALTVALTLITGVVLLLGGLAKLGAIADFLSRPVLTGFLTGVGLTVAIGQVPKIMGVDIDADGFFLQLFELFGSIPDADGPTVLMGLGALGLLFVLHRWLPKVPSALVVVVLSILAVGAFDLEGLGIDVVGDISSGLPSLVIPDVGLGDVTALLGGAIGLAIVVFGQSAALAKAFALPHRESFDGNQEMRAIGIANLAGGLFGTFTTSGSDSRTAAANAAGQQSQFSTLMVGVMVLITAAFFTGLFHDLPDAVLGAIVVHAALGLVEVQPFRLLFNQNRADFWAAIATLAGVLVFEVLAGLLIGVFVSLGMLMAKVVRPRVVELTLDPETGVYRSAEDEKDLKRIPGLRIVRFDSPLFFANVSRLKSVVDETVQDSSIETMIIDIAAVDDLDTTTVNALQAMMARADDSGVWLVFARMHRTVRDDLERGRLNLADRVYPRVADAVDAFSSGGIRGGRSRTSDQHRD